MKRYLLLLTIGTILSASQSSDIIKDMLLYKQEQVRNIELNHKENVQLIEQNKAYYTKISQRATAYYKKFVSKKWREENIKLSNITTFTQYNKNMDARQSIDFKNGIVTIEVISDKKDSDVKYFDKTIKKLSDESISQAIKKDPVNSLETKFMEKKSIVSKHKKAPDNSKFLAGFIETKKISKKDIKHKKVVLDNGDEKFISYVEVKMVPDHLKKRAMKFKPFVLKKSREYGIEPSVIFATIQTESYFNPLAKSHVPAYGLMQIVPTTAGVDAYYALTKKKKLLSPNYLYNANNNIELGSKYIQIIRKNYLKGIKNPQSKFYCAAVSYNAGIGSLYYSFAGSKRKRAEAIRIINSMTPEQVYHHIRTSNKLTKEARNYVKSIKERSENYKMWDREV